MEQQQASTSKVTVEYHDPHDVYKLLAPGLIPRLPLHDLHWKSHSGPLRSIGTLHVDLVYGGEEPNPPSATSTPALRRSDSTARDDGFQTQSLGGRGPSSETVESSSQPPGSTSGNRRRHQIPGLRRTPYLKVLLVRCDDNDSYKSSVRSEVREWIKSNTSPTSSSKKSSNQERHDACEWLIVHVVIPNTAAATQPRSTSTKLESSESKGSSRWRTGSTPLLEKFRSDFNGSGKGAVDHVAQIRIGINDVPYDLLPRVVPAVPTGYSETEQDAEKAWAELVGKFKDLILSSFDQRVSQYEEDIKEKDSQRTLPGWNFCTFFILKEGLARGFENVGLVEDALVGYDELSVGLDSIVKAQSEDVSPAHHGGVLLGYTEDLKKNLGTLLAGAQGGEDDEEAVNLQSKDTEQDQYDEILISSTKKPYRDMILANKVSVFDFRCYIFSRQIALLLRLGNAQSTREELLAKLKEQQESVLHGVAPQARPPQKKPEEGENLSRLAEICRRTLEFIPAVSYILRRDITAALTADAEDSSAAHEALNQSDVVDNVVASFAFSVAQQILAQTSTKAVPIPPSTLPPAQDELQKVSIPEPKTMMHPARSSSLHVRPTQRPPPSPGVFPGPGQRASLSGADILEAQHAKSGLEELAAKRADLYLLSRSILNGLGKRRGWSNGWDEAPLIADPDMAEMEDVSLDDNDGPAATKRQPLEPSPSGINSKLLRTAIDTPDDFYRLYEILTDKAIRHFTVAGQDYSSITSMSDLAVLKFHLREYSAATSFFCQTTSFFGDRGWSWLELSMLVMYARCLKEMQSKEYVRVALKLLTQAAAAEEEWLREKASCTRGGSKSHSPDVAPIAEVVGSITDLATYIPNDAKMPLRSFATDIEIAGPPKYHDNRDSCELSITLRSLLPGEVSVSSVALRASSLDDGPSKEVWFKNESEILLKRGVNTLVVECTSVAPGRFRVDHLDIRSSKLWLNYDAGNVQTFVLSDRIFSRPDIRLYQRAEAFDVDLSACRYTTLDKNNALDLTVYPGWNNLASCEVRVKPATGGLRLLTTDATLIDTDSGFAKPPEAGVFFLGPMKEGTSLTVRFPYTVEQDMGTVAARLEVTYKTEAGGSYSFAKSSTIPIGLALNVNVHDVFKHEALYSRFSVTTASGKPLRLIASELLEAELFEPSSGMPPSDSVFVFSKQPATFLYKIKRKSDGVAGKRTGKTMQLKLHYSQLDSEIGLAFRAMVSKSVESTDLSTYKRAIDAIIDKHLSSVLDGRALEEASLLGEVPTGMLADIQWESHLQGLGAMRETGEDVGVAVSNFFKDWLESHHCVPILPPGTQPEPSSILIPVEIPSVSVVHTADIRLQKSVTNPPDESAGPTPTVTIGQVLSATLQLRWTRIWDTSASSQEDKEFSYEVTAPPEGWLLGGRRRGHFVIPGDSTKSSTPGTEAEIPLTLIPQREGWLPYPSVEIKEISADGEVVEQAAQSFEVDFRNLGETVRVVGGRKGVTVSLDAGGPGGGPLVLEGERMRRQGERVIA